MTRLRITACLLAALTAGGCITIELPGGLPQPLVETTVHGDSGPKILMIQVDGVISEEPSQSSFFSQGESRVARLREELERARKDDAVAALLLRINSPGGTVTASDIVHHEILRLKREKNIPVVAQLMGVAASGGYYVAMTADRIVAQPTAVTGSIGVIFGGVNLAGLMEKVGIEDQTLVSVPHKDAGSFLRRMTPDEREHLQSVLDDMHARFVSVVGDGRPDLDAAAIEAAADGRIYSATQALERGLVDRLGSLLDAVEVAEELAGIETSRVVTYHRPREFRDNLYSVAAPAPDLDFSWSPRWQALLPQPSFLYLWTPGPF